MFPAARIGDPVTHDQTVPSGVVGPPLPAKIPNVIIEGLPAATIGDFVTCTGVICVGIFHPPQAGPPPSTPPSVPIIKGSATVLINFMPAARWITDMSACGVLLGDLKLFSSRRVFIGDVAGGGGAGGAAGAGPGGPLTKVIEAYTMGTSASVGPVPPEHTGPLQPEEEEKEKTWIGIELKDFEGQPMPNHNFQVTLDSGQVLLGCTDSEGYARFDNLDPDSGNVAFTELTQIKDQATGEGADEVAADAQTTDYDQAPVPTSQTGEAATEIDIPDEELVPELLD